MRLKPLLFFILVAVTPLVGTVYAQQRPQTIDDLFNPRPTAPVPQQQQQPAQRPGGIETQPLPPPPAEKQPAAKAKKKRDDSKQLEAKDQPGGVRDIIAPPAERGVARKGKAQPELPVDQGPADQRIANQTAIFSGLDKVTGRIYPFEVAIKETVQFGALRVTPQACYTRPPTEPQNTTGFVEVDEITLEGKIRRVFTGWMFAASPGLHAVEHPIYDVWLVDCKQGPPDIAKSQG